MVMLIPMHVYYVHAYYCCRQIENANGAQIYRCINHAQSCHVMFKAGADTTIDNASDT